MCNLSEKWIEIFVGPMASGQKLFPQICTDQGFGFCPDLSDLSDHRIQQIFASCTIHTQIFFARKVTRRTKKNTHNFLAVNNQPEASRSNACNSCKEEDGNSPSSSTHLPNHWHHSNQTTMLVRTNCL
jgi:hypothetical protein